MNIENPPVSVNFDVKQNSTDLTAIDLKSLSVIIRDKMNEAIDGSQYIVSNCDLLKKNCSFNGEVIEVSQSVHQRQRRTMM